MKLIAALMLAASVLSAQQHPNFSGRWRMIKGQSDFGKFQTPDLITRTIDQHDPTMNVHTVQTTGSKTAISDVSYYLDGRESTNILSGRDAVSKAFWDGDALMVRTDTKTSKGDDVEILDRWQLSPDGKTLTMTSHIGNVELRLVCEKQ